VNKGVTTSVMPRSVTMTLIRSAIDWLERIPYSLLAVPLRLAVATVFWNSAQSHLASWDTTIELFQTEYSLPLIPPVFAAYFAVAVEVGTPIMLVLGLWTRAASLLLLGMVTVIEVFVYPQAWPTHIQWAAMLLVLLSRGAGRFSVDQILKRYLPTGK
jgi:putative oxidoreductase